MRRGNAADIDFTDTVENFFMTREDTLDLPRLGVGEVLYAFEETLALDEVRTLLDLVLTEAGGTDDRVPAILAHERWPEAGLSIAESLAEASEAR